HYRFIFHAENSMSYGHKGLVRALRLLLASGSTCLQGLVRGPRLAPVNLELSADATMISLKGRKLRSLTSLAARLDIRLAAMIAIALALSMCTPARSTDTPGRESGRVSGTVIDVNGDP